MHVEPSQIAPADAPRVRKALIQAQEPLIEWLIDPDNGSYAVAITRELAQEQDARRLLVWLAESENVQVAFRRIRELVRDELLPSGENVAPEDADRVRGVLLRSAQEVVSWLEDERNTAHMIVTVLEVGETYDIERVMRRFENDSGRLMAQRVFQIIRARMMGSRPVSLGSRAASETSDLAGLAAHASFR